MRQFLKHHLSKKNRDRLLSIERLTSLLTKPKVLKDILVFNKKSTQARDTRFSTHIRDIFPITGENTPYTSFDRHYVYHTSWAARVVKELHDYNMQIGSTNYRHTDISSSLYFCGLVSAFIPVDFYDYRPADLQLEGLTTHTGNLMKLPFSNNSLPSISCLHTIEHVGLGRYGDPIDPTGDIKAITELKRVVTKGGSLLLVVPVGRQRIEFNAHRIYSPSHVKDLVCSDGNFTLKEYAYVPETDREGGIIRNAPLEKGEKDTYACGCFWFVKNS
jgi:hypothetical protein